MEKALLWGAGKMLDEFYEMISTQFEIVGIIDNNKDKWNTKYKDIIISSPDILFSVEYNVVCVTTSYDISFEIKEQLINMGIPKNKIRFYGESGVSKFRINPEFFELSLSYEKKKELFSDNVERVVIEVNSKCNRKCWFCPNSIYHQNDGNIDMNEYVFQKIISELKEINYCNEICLSLYNEPLLCTDLANKVRTIKNQLPNSFVYLFSNGDLINKSTLDLLTDAGLDYLFIDIYLNQKEYDSSKAYNKAVHILNSLEIEPGKLKPTKNRLINGIYFYKGMGIEIASRDFTIFASNRAESIPKSIVDTKIESHSKTCIKTFIGITIDYEGNIWPCPNYYRNYDGHKKYCIGNVMSESIFDIYLGSKMNAYREKHMFHRDELPCRSCVWNINSFFTNRYYREFKDRK